jgi:hypothetical protein
MGRSLVIGIVTTFLLIGGLATFFYINYVKVKKLSAINAIPNDAALILEVKNISGCWATFSTSDIWKDLSKNEALQELNYKITYIDSLISLNNDLKNDIAHHRSVISVHTQNGQKMALLFVSETGSNTDAASIARWIAKANQYTLKKHSFEQETVYDFLDKDKMPVMSMTYRDQLLICSSEGVLVEEVIRKLKYKLPNDTRGFEQITAMAEVSNDVSIFVNYTYFPSFLNVFLKSAYCDLFAYLKRFANWSMFNVKINKDFFNLSGVSYTDDSVFQYLDLFKTQTPAVLTLHTLIPKNTAMMLQTAYSDYTKFGIDLTEYLQVHQKIDEYTRFADSLDNRYGIDLGDKLFSLIGNEALLGILESSGADYEKELFAAVRFTDVVQAKTVLNSYVFAIKKRGEYDSIILPSYNGFVIEHLQLGNFLKLYYGETFENIVSPYYTVIDDAVVFANKPETLKLIIDSYQSGNTLAKSKSYSEYSQKSASTANVNFYINPSYGYMLPAGFVTDEFFSTLSRYQYDFKKFEYMSVQFANTSNKAFFTNLNIQFNSSFEEDTRILWNVKLDTSFDMNPVVVFNSTTRQNCILVQDASNTLYYISANGNIVWKSKLSGKIISPIKQIDPKKSGHVYYLFNTQKQVYLVDEQGDNMIGYPVRFPGNATAALSMVDFYGDSVYRFFVPLDNSRVIGYEINGKPLQGWNPKTVPEKIASELSMIKVGTTPYILGSGAKGSLLMYTVKGTLVKLDIPVTISDRVPVLAYASDTSMITLVIVDTTGTLVSFELTSSLKPTFKNSLQLGLNPEYFMTFTNLKKNRIFLVGNDKEFSVYDQSAHKLSSTSVNDSSTFRPFINTTVAGDIMIGYTDKQLRSINWVTTSGTPYSSFPMEGATTFTVDNLMLDGSHYVIRGAQFNNLVLIKLK